MSGVSEAAAMALPEAAVRGGVAAFIETTKPRITRLVTVTSGVGFVLAAVGRGWGVSELAVTASGCVLGTALSASGANALNQWMEVGRDAAMPRTMTRPLPQARIAGRAVLWGGVGLCAAGLAVLLAACGPVPALVSLATILSYLLVYTPLKSVTPLATLVGAVPGALPPLIGWTAASGAPGLGSLAEPGGWALFLLMFVWQVPHFLAIAWLYKDDYAAGGYKVLPVLDPGGRETSLAILTWTLLFVPASMAPALAMGRVAGGLYAALALVSGAVFLRFAARLARTRTRGDARAAFIASVIHLPVLMAGIVVGAVAGLVG